MRGASFPHCASAMTLSGKKDGDEASVLDLVDIVFRLSASVEEDLRELYRGILFTYMVNNTDCHLMNHSFLYTKDGWRLGPMYDVNASPEGMSFALTLDGEDDVWSWRSLLDLGPWFDLAKAEAGRIADEVMAAASGFAAHAGQSGASARDMDSVCFRMCGGGLGI